MISSQKQGLGSERISHHGLRGKSLCTPWIFEAAATLETEFRPRRKQLLDPPDLFHLKPYGWASILAQARTYGLVRHVCRLG